MRGEISLEDGYSVTLGRLSDTCIAVHLYDEQDRWVYDGYPDGLRRFAPDVAKELDARGLW